MSKKQLVLVLSEPTEGQEEEYDSYYEDVHLEEVLKAEEIWLSSSTKELAPVVKLNGVAINEGVPGPRWEAAQSLFQQYRFSDF